MTPIFGKAGTPGGHRPFGQDRREKCWKLRWFEGKITLSAPYDCRADRTCAYDITLEGLFTEKCTCHTSDGSNPPSECSECDTPPYHGVCVEMTDIGDSGDTPTGETEGVFCRNSNPEDTGILCYTDDDWDNMHNCDCLCEKEYTLTFKGMRIQDGYFDNGTIANSIIEGWAPGPEGHKDTMSDRDWQEIQDMNGSSLCDCSKAVFAGSDPSEDCPK